MGRTGALNPTPISKLLVTLLLAFSMVASLGELSLAITVLFIAVFFALNGRVKTAVKAVFFYGVVIFLLHNISKIEYAFVRNYIVTFVIVIKIFFVPFLAGKFFLATSDVSSIIISLEKMRLPKVLVIPIAVVFRYFPAFKDDKNNIKMAMKMRGISHKNPVKYLEYVSIPILMSATNIADDISKSAETRCIAEPCKKTRYAEVKFGWIDIVYMLGILALNIWGRLYA